ncbi:MAG: radical SAM protein [Candidatus Omnitrophota bacterium]
MMLTKIIRNILSDKKDDYTFYASDDTPLYINPQKEFGLYIHVPFCKSMCPYCPYTKVLYDKYLAGEFKQAIIRELKLYFEKLGKRKFSSIYIGGGTPTLLLEELRDILDEIRKCFDITGPIAVETIPSDVSFEKMRILKQMGVNYISLGVQSFNSKYLSLVGRNYAVGEAEKAITLIKKEFFDLFNVDLIFAYPQQETQELYDDLIKVLSFAPDQVTAYPLFTFPYTSVGKYMKIKRLIMPPVKKRKEMYYLICDFFNNNSYHQSTVWGFNKNKTGAYSSVTRDYYIGLGTGAATYTGEGFYFNTFSLPDYIKTSNDRVPIALRMNVSERLRKLFWLYWRLYETSIPREAYKKEFRVEIDKDFGFLLNLSKWLQLAHSHDSLTLKLNKIGSHWIHLIQNHYALNYVSKVWSLCQREPWPNRVVL